MAKLDDPTIERVEETFRIDKQQAVTGRVRVKTSSELVEEIVPASLASETVEVTRKPIGREVVDAPKMRTEGDVTIIPVLEEIVVVEKRLVLVEEIRIKRIRATEDVTIPVTLRKQQATVERLDKGNPNREE